MPGVKPKRPIKWAYGVTTVPQRIDDLLPMTLKSLAAGGFDEPRLFVDGVKDTTVYNKFGLEVTSHYPKLQIFGNWVLALWELYLRDPDADRFAIFQDDMVTYKNLLLYLEQCEYPKKGYWNLYTFPENQNKAPKDDGTGWFLSTQNGRGAVALVFSREAVVLLLKHQHIVDRPMSSKSTRVRLVDGAVMESFRKSGWKEYTHNPTLVDHTGMTSVTRNGSKIKDSWKAKTFKGTDFDAIEMPKTSAKEIVPVGFGVNSQVEDILDSLGIPRVKVTRWLRESSGSKELRGKLAELSRAGTNGGLDDLLKRITKF